MLAAAFGGSVPPIIWDGVGGAEAKVYSSDDVPVLNLGMTKSDQPIETAQPALAKLAGDAAPTLPKIVVPDVMEAAIR